MSRDKLLPSLLLLCGVNPQPTILVRSMLLHCHSARALLTLCFCELQIAATCGALCGICCNLPAPRTATRASCIAILLGHYLRCASVSLRLLQHVELISAAAANLSGFVNGCPTSVRHNSWPSHTTYTFIWVRIRKIAATFCRKHVRL